MIYETESSRETFVLAKKLGERAKPGQIYTLNGDLGVGKTLFAKGFAEGMGIRETVNSPTFTIVQVYGEKGESRLPLYHFDVYRVGDVAEMEEIGYEDYFYGQGVCLVEWAELISDLLPENCIQVKMEKDMEKGFDYRKITVDIKK